MNQVRNWKWIVGRAGASLAVVTLIATVVVQAGLKLPGDLALCLTEAEQANAAHDIEQERKILEHAEALEGEAKDAAEVQRRLAVLDWKYEKRYEEARQRLLRATTDGAEPADAWIALARMEQARRNHSAAREAATAGLNVAEEESRKREAGMALARASVAEAAGLRRQGDLGQTEPLRQAFDHLLEREKREPGYLEPSRWLLRAALLLDRGDAALLAWRSYYRVAPGIPGPNAIADAGAELGRILPGWKGAAASASERIDLVEALSGTRFFFEAALIALDPRADDSVREHKRVIQVLAYAEALHELRAIAEEYYRQTILGNGDEDAFRAQTRALAPPVLETLGIDVESFSSDDALNEVLGDRFGSYINLGNTAGYFDLHMGHRVIDETRTVEQYAHTTELRFVMLDNMVSNGFQSWAWESGAQHGGWAGPDTMWQVRPAYAGSATEIWRKTHSKEEVAEFEEKLERETALDAERAAEDPHAFLLGLAMRLQIQGVQAVKARLEKLGFEGGALRLAFLAEYDRTVQESSIFAHEGRHAIDKRLKTKMKGWKREYYAKLSEAVFTDDPRLAVSSIFGPNIGDPTPHGQSNLRIMKDIVKWMKKHRDEIRGLDATLPLLPQFDLLTDEQIREAFRSADPLAG